MGSGVGVVFIENKAQRSEPFRSGPPATQNPEKRTTIQRHPKNKPTGKHKQPNTFQATPSKFWRSVQLNLNVHPRR